MRIPPGFRATILVESCGFMCGLGVGYLADCLPLPRVHLPVIGGGRAEPGREAVLGDTSGLETDWSGTAGSVQTRTSQRLGPGWYGLLCGGRALPVHCSEPGSNHWFGGGRAGLDSERRGTDKIHW